MINVLLVSPRLPPTDPRRCGDHTYTDLMLQYPPPGVNYLHYEDLIVSGKARRIRSLQALSYYLIKARVLPPDVWFESIETEIEPDIIHVYGFSAVVRLPKRAGPVPVVLGAGTGGYSDLKYYHGWDESAIRRARRWKRLFLRLVHAHDSSLLPERAASVLTWSAFSRSMHLDEGYVRPEQISVLYPGLPAAVPSSPKTQEREGLTFLFVGRDFERKNGPMALEAFRTVHASFPATRLILIGQNRNGDEIEEDSVVHHSHVPREELMQDFYPRADVFLLPSRAEGFGLVIMEAMAHGLPCIAVDAWAMPEIIQDGVNGFLIKPNDSDALIERMMRLSTQPRLTASMRQKALQVFREKFDIAIHNQQLRAVYTDALSRYYHVG